MSGIEVRILFRDKSTFFYWDTTKKVKSTLFLLVYGEYTWIHTALPGACSEHSTLSVSLSSNQTIDRWLYPEGRHNTPPHCPLKAQTGGSHTAFPSVWEVWVQIKPSTSGQLRCTDVSSAAGSNSSGCNKHSLLSVGLHEDNSLINECRLRFKHLSDQSEEECGVSEREVRLLWGVWTCDTTDRNEHSWLCVTTTRKSKNQEEVWV